MSRNNSEKKVKVIQGAPSGLIVLLGAACGLIVANIYLAQPLVGPIAQAMGLPLPAAGVIVTITQLGYAAGLFFVVPLGDLVENRRLVVVLLGVAALGLFGTALSSGAPMFFSATLFVGIGSVAVQVLVPYAAHIASPAGRGKAVGNVMSGLMLGILLARPFSSFVTQISSWRTVFVLSGVFMLVAALAMAWMLPQRLPNVRSNYLALLRSMVRLAWFTPVLQRRAVYHAFLFGAFSLFWTAAPLLLAGPAYRLSQGSIALFALVGLGGVVASPIAGRIADKGWGRPATGLAMATVALSFVITRLAPQGSALALGLLVGGAILLDFGLLINMIVGQSAIFALGDESRARLNGLYMTTFFVGGAVGSALAGWTFANGGWDLASWLGVALPMAALLFFSTERKAKPCLDEK